MKISDLDAFNVIPPTRVFPCRVIAVSSGVAGVALLIKQFITGGLPAAALLLLLLVASFTALRRVRLTVVRLTVADPLTPIIAGFLINAGGWLAVMIGLQQGAHWSVISVGVLMVGAGQGVSAGSLKGFILSPLHRRQKMITAVISLLSAGVCLVVEAFSSATEGLHLAVALLIDLSLLGAIYTKIVRDDDQA